jgi:CDP-6-deoxy-D-xylo-4-hexulose-3-dehydrase
LGSKYLGKSLGTFGDFGTFSFYYSHQITSGEGGMIVCKNKEDYNLLHTLRAHGWDRGLSGKNKNTFNFINSGFNLRPLDLTAAIGLNQLKRLNDMMATRKENKDLITKSLKNSNKWKNQFQFFEPNKNLNPSWFGFPLLINKDYLNDKDSFIKNLNFKNIETRPILSGNFLKQPASKLYGLDKNKSELRNTEEIDKTGFFIGLPTKKIEKTQLNFLIDNLLKIKKN